MSSIHFHKGLFPVSLSIECISSHRLLLRIQPGRCTGSIHNLVERAAKEMGGPLTSNYNMDMILIAMQPSAPDLICHLCGCLLKCWFAVSGLDMSSNILAFTFVFMYRLYLSYSMFAPPCSTASSASYWSLLLLGDALSSFSHLTSCKIAPPGFSTLKIAYWEQDYWTANFSISNAIYYILAI